MDDNRKKALAAALGQIEKQFGKGSVMRLGDGSAAKDIESAGGRAISAPGSVSDPADTDAMVAAAEDEFGGLDIVVNNAGLTAGDWLHRMSDETWNVVVDVCLNGTFNVCRSSARLLRRPKDDPADYHRKVVNIASVNGIYGTARNTNYSAAKAGVIGLSKALAREWAGQRINVNVVAPGFVETEMTAALGDEQREQLVAQIPLKRLGSVADVAGTVLFLCGPAGAYLTGETIHVNGGMLMV